MADNPLAAPIDRALDKTACPHDGLRLGLIRDAILAEIEAEFGPLALRVNAGEPSKSRLVSEWRE